MAFLVAMGFNSTDSAQSVSLFIEYIAQQGLRAQTLSNYVSVLNHFFSLYAMDTSVLQSRVIKLAIKSVAHNAPLSFKIKGVLTVKSLRSLVQVLKTHQDSDMLTSLVLLSFFGFFRLAMLVPSARSGFSAARYPTHGDVIWGPPGAHLITKCAKNRQVSGHSQIVQLPQLPDKLLCPVSALHQVVSSNPIHRNKPIFMVEEQGVSVILTASRVRLALRKAISAIGLEPKEYGYHSLRRSGACWAFDYDINVDHIHTHGGWKSDVVWKYLTKTPKAASSVARAFQQLIT